MAKQNHKMNADVAAVFDSYEDQLRSKLLSLRDIIFDVAAETDGVGKLEETLRWGQPSYITSETKSGSLVRIDRVKSENSKYAIYFHCQTGLIDTFRAIYPDHFRFEGKRAIVFGFSDDIPDEELKHCISMALTHKFNRKLKS